MSDNAFSSEIDAELDDEDSFKHAIKEFNNKQKLEWHTQVDDAEITRLICAYLISEEAESLGIINRKHLDRIVLRKLKLRVSNERRGRQEFVELFRGESQYNQSNSKFINPVDGFLRR